MSFSILFGVLLVTAESYSETVTFSPAPSNVAVEDGGTATFICVPLVDGVAGRARWRVVHSNGILDPILIDLNRTDVFGATGYLSNDPGRTRLILTNVGQTLNEAQIICSGTNLQFTITAVEAPPVTLSVHIAPTITFNGPFQPVEGEDFTVSSTSYHPGNPLSTVSLSYGRSALTNGSGVVVLLNSSSLSVVFPSVHRSRSGTYSVTLTNIVGNSTASFSVDIQYPPSLMNVNESARTVLVGEDLTLDCTPIPGKPSNLSLTFKVNGLEVNQNDPSMSINNFVLTITSVQRRHTGTYMCEASNGVGGPVTASIPVNVFGPPTAPKALTVVDVTPFSARVRWNPPEDNGGVELIQYKYNISNSTTVLSGTTNSTMTTLTNLQHSTSYTVSVLAENVHGRSSQVESPFRTRDSVPIIHLVTSEALSLFNITVHVTLLTTGGQTVTGFDISVNGTMATDSTMVVDDRMMTISLVVSGLKLLKGEMYMVSVTANNSVGRSDPVIGVLFVPNPPNITANFSQLPPSTISTCCSGVKLNLADPSDVSEVNVLLNTSRTGSLEMVSTGNLNLTGDILYISGLQAGTVYTANITVSNIFGLSWQSAILKPLLGRPSNPASTTVTVEGTVVTVVLNTAYPGTERTRSGNNFRFELQFTKSGISTRQSNSRVQPFTPSTLTTPVNTTYSTTLDSGTYTMRVTAVNEHGSSESVLSQAFVVTEPSTQPPTPASQTIIIGAVVGVVVFVLLVLILIFICIICYKKFWRTRGHYKTESGKPVPLTNNGANGDNKEDIEMMENQTALYDEVDRAGAAAKKKKEAEAMGVVNQYDDPDVQQQPEMYAEVDHSAKTSNKKKKKKEEKQQVTTPQPEVYAEVDKATKTSKKGAEAQDDEPKPPPHTEGLVYAQIDFANKSSTYKKPEPKNDDVVIYSEVTVQHQPRKQDDDKEQDGNNDRDDRAGSPNAII